MARQQFNDGQEIVFEDLNKLQSRAQQELYDRVLFELIAKKENAFFGDGLKVNFASATSVTITPGVGFQTDATVDSSEPQKRLLYRGSGPTLNLSSPDGALDRIDVVSVKHAIVDGATESRKFKNASTSVITNENLVVTNDWEAAFTITPGTPAGSPSAPATPAGEVKIAELYVTAVTGMSGSGAVTDFRAIMPILNKTAIDTLGKLRLTAGASTSLDTLFADIDALLVDGRLNTNTFDDSVSDPAAPATAGQKKLYLKGNLLFLRDSVPDGSAITPVGSGGGGGGGGANWVGGAPAPVEDEEFNEKIWKFAQGATQSLVLYAKVPQGYVAGRQIVSKLGVYSPSISNEFSMQVVTTLLRKNVDAITSTTNQNTSNSGDLTNTVANQYREISIDLSNATGQINGVSVSPGDLLKLELTRIAPGGTEDTADVRFAPSATEVKFG